MSLLSIFGPSNPYQDLDRRLMSTNESLTTDACITAWDNGYQTGRDSCAKLKERMMPYRERDQEARIEELEAENERLERALDRARRTEEEQDDQIETYKRQIDDLQEDVAAAKSRRRGFFGSAERERLEVENNRLRGELDIAAKHLEEVIAGDREEIERLTDCCKRDGERSLKLMTERDKLKDELREATALRAHAIAVELVHAHLRDPEWLPHGVAAKMIDDSGLAGKVMELQREREAVTNAQNDVGGMPGLGYDAKGLVQLLVGERRQTIILPLRHALTAIRAAIECWGQEVMEKANALKGGGL